MSFIKHLFGFGRVQDYEASKPDSEPAKISFRRRHSEDSTWDLLETAKASNYSIPKPPSTAILVSKMAELYKWDPVGIRFLKKADVCSSINLRSLDNTYWMEATTDAGKQVLWYEINLELNVRWSSKLSSATWDYVTNKNLKNTWCLKFPDKESYAEFKGAFTVCLEVCTSTGPEMDISQARLTSGYSESDSAEDSDGEIDGLSEVSESDTEANRNEFGRKVENGNSHLAVGNGRGKDMAFVARGMGISVFKHTDEGKMECSVTIDDLNFKKMRGFEPKLMMLHDQDTKIILANSVKGDSLFSLDIEQGKIVEEWRVKDGMKVNSLAPSSKYSQITSEKTFVGTSANALFRIDPRQGGRGRDTIAESREYVTNGAFSGITTAADGKLAVVSQNGEIRLFGSVGKIAKTALPAIGEATIGIDVTGDGRWIVATCKKHLFIIDTLISSGKNAGSLGYSRAFPIDLKPQPMRLQLRKEHSLQVNDSASFSPARFNKGIDGEESSIVTSIGHFVVAWDFRKIKRNIHDSYFIKRYDVDVIQNNFKFGGDDEIIVTFANDVLVLRKKRKQEIIKN